MLLRNTLCTLFLSLLLLPGSQIQAHRLKTILTTVELNPRSGMLEIVHQSFAHDVEHTFSGSIRTMGGLESIEGSARVALELSKSFALWGEDEQPLELTLVGAELESEYFYIYQEAPMLVMPDELRVHHTMLLDHWPDMTNYVNVAFEDEVKTLVFSKGHGPQTVSASQ